MIPVLMIAYKRQVSKIPYKDVTQLILLQVKEVGRLNHMVKRIMY